MNKNNISTAQLDVHTHSLRVIDEAIMNLRHIFSFVNCDNCRIHCSYTLFSVDALEAEETEEKEDDDARNARFLTMLLFALISH